MTKDRAQRHSDTHSTPRNSLDRAGLREEPAAEATDVGLIGARTVALEGPVWMTGSRLTEFRADEQPTAVPLDMLRRVEDEPSLFGASSHLLTVAHRGAP